MENLEEENSKEERWSQDELREYKNGAAALAAAVIKQWKLDGCPKSGEKQIKMWKKVYDEARSLKGES